MNFIYSLFSGSSSENVPSSRPPAKMQPKQLPLPSSSESSGSSKLLERQVSIRTSSLTPVSSSSSSSSLSSSVPVPSSSSSSSEVDNKELAAKKLEEAIEKLKDAFKAGIKLSSFYSSSSSSPGYSEEARKAEGEREPFEAAYQLYCSSISPVSSSSDQTLHDRSVWEEILKKYEIDGEQLGFLIPFNDSSRTKNSNFFANTRGSFRISFTNEGRKWLIEMRTLDYKMGSDSGFVDGNFPRESLSQYLHPSEQYKRIDRLRLERDFGVVLPKTPVVKDGKIEIFMPSSPRDRPLLVDYNELLTFNLAKAIYNHPDAIKACNLVDKKDAEKLEEKLNYRGPK